MSNPPTGTVDGKVPIMEPAGSPWRMWNKAELWNGTVGEGRFVPKLNDYAKDLLSNTDFRIIDLDPTTLVPTYVEVPKNIDSGEFTQGDLLQGVGPGTEADTFRVYIDKSVIPFALSVDRRAYVSGNDVIKAKIFRGTDLSNNQHVISMFFDQSGHMLGQDIPLELVAMDNSQGQNVSVKICPTCYTTEDLPDNEVVTVVYYSTTGNVVWKRQLLVENSAFISSANTSAKYVTHIGIESPFLSTSDATLLLYPLNVLVSGLNLVGVVYYSNGDVVRMPVDGTKFAIRGLEAYVATTVGQQIPLELFYYLSPNELHYGSTVGADRFIPLELRARTKEVDGSFSPKLFGYPVWIDAANGYRMEWWLGNLERTAFFKATPHVYINANTNAFDPVGYGTVQRLSVSVDLSTVNPSLGHFIHTQILDVVLISPATVHTTGDWTVSMDPGQNPPYGRNVARTTMLSATNWRVRIDQGETDFDAWLERMYYRTRPLYDTTRETKAPAPTHFAIVFPDQTLEFQINQWNTDLLVNHTLTFDDTMFIKFFKRTSDNNLELSIAGLSIWPA